ncbi:DUF1793-domain-containing protein [Trichodelitschia bisporula]|uniref:DUF1793-domain-containing protein n=1 Tax=Trichodelitschia bisporula TaxID=703511 RepID=A0A6G1HYT2_9PEZI|nr:DUF1793-domain-containing protein [Trichodelitschia bisporula]
MKLLSVVAAACAVGYAAAASLFSPARPPAIPLAVKSPYLSTWLSVGSDGGSGGYLAGQWPVHWTGKTTAWSGMIRVDGTVYQWMGNPGAPNADQVSFIYTSTQSIFTFIIEKKVQLIVTFLSPVTPLDLKRQSLEFSYMTVDVSSIDGKTHDVKLYTDISAEWAAGEQDAIVEWSQDDTRHTAYYKVSRRDQIAFSESDEPDGNGMADWGSIFYASDHGRLLTQAVGQDSVVRGMFKDRGILNGTFDTQFRAVNDRWPVFAFSHNIGNVGSQAFNARFTIGLTQRQAVQFLGAQGLVSLPPLWTNYFADELEALDFFHNDFTNMQSISTDLDRKVAADSIAAGGMNYLAITSLSVRQAFGATELVGNKDKTYLFMKEISSNGNTQTVDVVFPLHPIILYTNPDLLRLMLDPLFENQESGHYPNRWSIHDLGSHFPNATGHSDGSDESMPVEECGNMLIMTLAYAQRANDINYLKQHYKILQQWAGFLIDDSLIPANQLSTDDFAGRLQNQTNLALKGIIGIGAMGEIAKLTGNADDAARYSSTAKSYIAQWQQLGIARDANPPHTTLNYGNNDSHGLLYNLWCDQELKLGLVPQEVYKMQCDFYPTVRNKYGVALDTRHTWTKGDWEMFTAATCPPSTRDMFISDLAAWISTTPTNRPLTDLYDTITGDFPGVLFTARPVMGGTFALLVAPATPFQGKKRAAPGAVDLGGTEGTGASLRRKRNRRLQ